MGKAQQIECPGPVAAAPSGRPAVWPLEFDQSGFLRVERQAVLTESFRQHLHDAACVFLAREEQDGVVRITDEKAPALQPRCPGVWARQRPFLQDPGVQPLADESQQHSIAYPAAKKRS